jgi:hypothetical protein
MSLPLFFFFLFLILTFIICYQDFKHRLVSLWVLVIYSFTCIASVYFLDGLYALMANALSALLYFGLIFGVLLLYYFLKEKKFSNPVDSKIGLADVILFLAIALTLDTVQLVLFFSGVFLISALLGLFWFNKKAQTVPLAGVLCVFYCLYYFLVRVI